MFAHPSKSSFSKSRLIGGVAVSLLFAALLGPSTAFSATPQEQQTVFAKSRPKQKCKSKAKRQKGSRGGRRGRGTCAKKNFSSKSASPREIPSIVEHPVGQPLVVGSSGSSAPGRPVEEVAAPVETEPGGGGPTGGSEESSPVELEGSEEAAGESELTEPEAPVEPEPEEPAEPELPEEEPAGGGGGEEPFRFYSPTSFWNSQVAPGAPLDPNSEAIVGAFQREVRAEFNENRGPAINTTSYSVPLYTVPVDQPLVKVTLDTLNAPALQEAFDAVPIPPAAEPASGTDAKLVIWQPATDKLWEFWHASYEADGWHAEWGGATREVSRASGYYGPASWPGAKPWWGDSGASMGVVGGLITLEDLQRGVINHALQIGIPRVRAGVYAWPAQRTDGKSSDPLSLPEGAHLRLDPDLDLSTLQMPYLTRLLAQAAQRYGIYVINGAGSVCFNAEDPTRTATNPYRGPDGYFEGMYPRELLASFPWDHLQLLRMELSGA
jgi:hypothetical protein